ncbi:MULTISPECIES: NfeD family protein [unclassified Schlesneria]|uniref:NfeD family protein n=1 Tax=Schlesneria TaxID=656899 RepID=UPI002EF59CA5
MDSNAFLAVVLLIVGLAILAAEVFVPSGGLLGVVTFITLVISLIFAYRAWGTSSPNLFVAYCALLLLLVPTVIGVGFYILPQTSFGRRVLLEAPTPEEVTPYLEESAHLENLVGRFGITATLLNPGGIVNVSGERLQATSEGLSIDNGVSVRVIAVDGRTLIVRPGAPEEVAAEELTEPFDLSKGLDFEYPSST